MQPLDVSFYGPLKIYFNQKVSTWLKNHPGRVITHFQIGAIVNKAYGKAAAVNGFQKTGLWPVDPDLFPDYLFEPAETTNIPMQQDRVEPEEDSTATENLRTVIRSISSRSRQFDITDNCNHISRRQPTSTISSPI